MDLWHIALTVLLTGLLLGLITVYGYFSSGIISVESLVASWQLRFNYFFNTFVAPLFIFITAVVATIFDKGWLIPDLWLIAVFLFVFQVLAVTLSSRLLYVYRPAWLVSSAVSIGLSVAMVRLVMYIGPALIPSQETLSAVLWTCGVLLLLYYMREFAPFRFYDFEAQRKHVVRLYQKYQERYTSHLNKTFKKDAQLQDLFFAILITEDLNRPLVFRFFERLFFRFGFVNTTGIMQVTSKNQLSDIKSVLLAQDVILGSYTVHKAKEPTEYMLVRAVAFDYNDGDFYRELIVDTYYTLKAWQTLNRSTPE